MNIYSRNIITQTLIVLKNNNIQRNKIIIHKFLFFMRFMKITTGFSFEPYTYGPFSFDLANTLDSMMFFDEINFDKNGYNALTDGSDPSIRSDIANCFDSFKAIAHPFKFNTLECVGTLLYCWLVLKKLGADCSDDSIIKEYKQWKGANHNESFIRNYLIKLLKKVFATNFLNFLTYDQENLGPRLKLSKTVPHIGPKSRFEILTGILSWCCPRTKATLGPNGFPWKRTISYQWPCIEPVSGNHIAWFLNHVLSLDPHIFCPTNLACPNPGLDSTALPAGPGRPAGCSCGSAWGGMRLPRGNGARRHGHRQADRLTWRWRIIRITANM
jgi:hypothetical protein